MQILLDRLHWPVRLVRWQAAREIAALFGDLYHGRQMQAAFLDWLNEQLLEDDVVSGLAVLLCADWDAKPSFIDVVSVIRRPSILADLMLHHVYGFYDGGLDQRHSGAAPEGFHPSEYFLKYRSSHVPLILSTKISEAESKIGLPLFQQWAFEWDRLMEATGYPKSGFPYFFVDPTLQDGGVNGQFSQRQCAVYRSAYLRTLAFAVENKGMAVRSAFYYSSYSLPLNAKLAKVDPQPELNRFGSLGERFIAPDADLISLAKEAVSRSSVANAMRLVALRLPIHSSASIFGDLTLCAVLGSDDLKLEISDKNHFPLTNITFSQDLVGFGELSEAQELEKAPRQGETGSYIPLCEQLFALPMGYWLNDYFQAGLVVPAQRLFAAKTSIKADQDGLKMASGPDVVGTWQFWLDHWTPLYPADGATNIGSITTIREAEVLSAAGKFSLRLMWICRLRVWRRDGDYGKFVMSQTHFSFSE